MNVYATEINLFLIGKNVLTVMVPILINKNVFEPSAFASQVKSLPAV